MHLQSLPNELLKKITQFLNPTDYMSLHYTCRLLYSKRMPYNFQAPTEALDSFLRKAPLDFIETVEITEWSDEIIAVAFVRGLPVCQKLIESGQVSDKAYYLSYSDMPDYISYPLNCAFDSEVTLLTVCAMYGHNQLIELLLDHGFDINQRGNMGLTPLACAIGARQADACRLLIQRGAAMVNNDESWSVMHLAAELSTPEILEILVNAGGDVNLVNGEITLLDTAAECGTVENVQWLLEHGADLWMRRGDLSVLDGSIWNKNSAVFDYLLQRYLESDPPEYWKEDALTNAAHACNFKACRRLLDLGANVNGNPHSSETPLFWCLYGAHQGTNKQDIFDLLMEHGADLYVAAYFNLTGLMERLIMRDPRIVEWACREGHSGALHNAAKNDRVKACQVLIRHGADVNVTDEEGRTPLMFATHNAGLESLCTCLKLGQICISKDPEFS
ncbi:ankyrin repeat-containing domain protein [Gorgonomyces haynaldii]|nr:ankyrin repeat-containing domain protein [Gorgonomyces haynaldii]